MQTAWSRHSKNNQNQKKKLENIFESSEDIVITKIKKT